MKSFAKAISLGLTVIIDLMLPMGAGLWIDSQLSTTPLCTVIGLFLGVALAFYSLYQLTK